MHITEIKNKLNVSQLNLSRDTDKDGKATDWLRDWNNDDRVAIVMHQDVLAKIQSGDPNLGIKTEQRVSKGENPQPYTMHNIVAYGNSNVEATL